MVLDFDPVILEESGMDDDVFLQREPGKRNGPAKAKFYHPLVQVDDARLEELKQGGADSLNANDLADFDWTFGLSETFPGIKNMISFYGPLNFSRGFINGT